MAFASYKKGGCDTVKIGLKKTLNEHSKSIAWAMLALSVVFLLLGAYVFAFEHFSLWPFLGLSMIFSLGSVFLRASRRQNKC